MDLEEILGLAGLNQKEAKVYLASLSLGPETAFNIAKTAELKRTTVYFVLEELKEKGFVSIRKTRKATFYAVISPTRILNRLKNKEKNFAEALPQLNQIYYSQSHRPKIQIFEGKKGVRQIYLESEKYLKKKEGVLYFGSFAHFLREDYKDLLDFWINSLKNKNHHSREILDAKELKNSQYLEKVLANKNPNHEIRHAPKGISFLNNDNMIFGDKLAIFSLQKEVFVVLIESYNIAESYRNLFELAWRQSKPV